MEAKKKKKENFQETTIHPNLAFIAMYKISDVCSIVYSPSACWLLYNVSSLLLNLQTILTELDQTLDQQSRNKLVRHTDRFFKENPDQKLKVPTSEYVETAK